MVPDNHELARRNRTLGLGLGAFVVLVVLAFIIRFTLAGLPPDQRLYEQTERRAAAQAAAEGEGTEP